VGNIPCSQPSLTDVEEVWEYVEPGIPSQSPPPVYIAVGMHFNPHAECKTPNQTYRDSLRLQELLKYLPGESPSLYSFCKDDGKEDQNQHNMFGCIHMLSSVQKELDRFQVRKIHGLFFDWFRMPQAYAGDAMYHNSLFSVVLPFLADNDYLDSSSEIWIPGIPLALLGVKENEILLQRKGFKISIEYQLQKNILYKASEDAKKRTDTKNALKFLHSEDIYLSSENEKMGRFILLTKTDKDVGKTSFDFDLSNVSIGSWLKVKEKEMVIVKYEK